MQGSWLILIKCIIYGKKFPFNFLQQGKDWGELQGGYAE